MDTAQNTVRMIPCDSNQGSTDGPPLPELPDQFETRIEANIVQKNYSMELTEYYDYTNNMGATIFHRRDKEYRSIMTFQNLERKLIFRNNTCLVMNLTDSKVNIFNFTVDATGGHVKGVKDILYFGKQFGETYIGGDEIVRGIAVDHWQSCLKWGDLNGSFLLDYYFSKESFNTTSGAKQVPIRAIVNGTGVGLRHSNGSLHQFYHIYEFFSFQPGPIRDTSVFQVPAGVFCNGSVANKPMPKLPDQFTTGVEMTHNRENMGVDETTEQFFFDFPSKLLRNDISRPMSRGDYMRYGNKPLTFIYDFNSSLLYAIDKWEKNCSVRGLNVTLDQQDMELNMTMKRANGLFNFMEREFVYQGKKKWRGVPAESWATFKNSTSHLQEIFFVDSSSVMEFPPNIPPRSGGQGQPPNTGGRRPPTNTGGNRPPTNTGGDRPSGLSSPPQVPQVIIGILNRFSNQNENSTTRLHFFGFEPGHLEANAFDVSACYETGHHYTYMSLRTEGNYQRDVSVNHGVFYAAVRAAIARGAGVSSTRVASLIVEDYNSGSEIKVYFKLLDRLKVKGVTYGRRLDSAKSSLRKAVDAGLNFDVQFPTIERNFATKNGSLTEVSSSAMTVGQSDIGRYSPGSMAGLGIGMLIVGAILGLLGAYVIYKRIDTSVPYKVTD